MPKISLIVPIHNMQEYLRGCLDSVVRQTLEDIEVICVDDCSTDASAAILRDYASRDARVRVIAFSENRSVSQARKDAVLASTGEYILFVDADDSIELDACERLYAAVHADPVDILHFGAIIETTLPPDRTEWLGRFLRPYEGTLEGDQIFDGAFGSKRLYNFTIWDKLYSADLCKRSFSRIHDGVFPRGEDKYAYFVLSYLARTYRGLPGEVLYHYHFGRGTTGHKLISLPHFETSCMMGLAGNAIRDFLLEEGTLEQHKAQYEKARNELLLDCVANWSGHLGAEDRADGFDLMLKYWEASEVIAKVAELNWDDQGHVARLLRASGALTREPRDVRVVGTYYHGYSNGGVERILSTSIKLWRQLGYEVVLLTDLPPTADDYELPEGVHRVVIPSFFDVEADTYVARARAIEAAIDHYKIDVMVYHAWLAPILLWDLLLYKTKGVAVVTHCHSVFSQPVRTIWTYFAEMPSIYRLADAVVTLGEVDSAYWRNFNDNVIQVANPLTNDLDDVKVSSLESKNVLWLGRMSDEKRPHEALRIFAEVLKEEPEAKLFMVGDSADDAYMDGLHALIGELGIVAAVVMCGFHTDVRPFYEKASVFLMTSEYEGFSMTLSESQSAGVPCVMYDLPYLTLTRPGRGFVSVEFGDIDAAADAVVDLLADPEYRHRLGREARANIEELARFDFAGTWRRLFEDLARPTPELPRDENAQIMWETFLDHYRIGAERRNVEVAQLQGNLRDAKRTAKRAAKKASNKEHQLEAELRKVRRSSAFRLGRILTAGPRKISEALKRLGSG
jgi:glycosyltransferase involved in cell wall biosynthesis